MDEDEEVSISHFFLPSPSLSLFFSLFLFLGPSSICRVIKMSDNAPRIILLTVYMPERKERKQKTEGRKVEGRDSDDEKFWAVN